MLAPVDSSCPCPAPRCNRQAGDEALAGSTILVPPADLSHAALPTSAINKLGKALASACILLAASDLSLRPCPPLQCNAEAGPRATLQAALCKLQLIAAAVPCSAVQSTSWTRRPGPRYALRWWTRRGWTGTWPTALGATFGMMWNLSFRGILPRCLPDWTDSPACQGCSSLTSWQDCLQRHRCPSKKSANKFCPSQA